MAKKKWIALKQRVEIAGEVRVPEEGAIAVPASVADQLVEFGKAKAATDPSASPAKRKRATASAKSKKAPAPSRPAVVDEPKAAPSESAAAAEKPAASDA